MNGDVHRLNAGRFGHLSTELHVLAIQGHDDGESVVICFVTHRDLNDFECRSSETSRTMEIPSPVIVLVVILLTPQYNTSLSISLVEILWSSVSPIAMR